MNLPLPAPLVMTNLPLLQLLGALGMHWANGAEGAYIAWRGNLADNGASERDLGVSFRPVEASVRDTVAWLKAAGHLRV